MDIFSTHFIAFELVRQLRNFSSLTSPSAKINVKKGWDECFLNLEQKLKEMENSSNPKVLGLKLSSICLFRLSRIAHFERSSNF